jgi:hypothetical protein
MKREWNSLDVNGGHDCADQASIQGEEIQLAFGEHFQRCGIAAGKLVVVGECRYVYSPAGLRFYRGPHFDQALMQRAIGRLVVKLPQFEIRRSQSSAEES